jgi:hypothetical protein
MLLKVYLHDCKLLDHIVQLVSLSRRLCTCFTSTCVILEQSVRPFSANAALCSYTIAGIAALSYLAMATQTGSVVINVGGADRQIFYARSAPFAILVPQSLFNPSVYSILLIKVERDRFFGQSRVLQVGTSVPLFSGFANGAIECV